jgi:hypothetical protein
VPGSLDKCERGSGEVGCGAAVTKGGEGCVWLGGGGGGALAIWGGSSLIKAVDILRNASALKQTEEELLWRASLLGDGPSVFFFSFPLEQLLWRAALLGDGLSVRHTHTHTHTHARTHTHTTNMDTHACAT